MVELISSILGNVPNGWHLGSGGRISIGMEDHTNARAFAFVLLKTREDMMVRVQGQGSRGASEMYAASKFIPEMVNDPKVTGDPMARNRSIVFLIFKT